MCTAVDAMLRRLICFTLLVLLSPALAAAQRCDPHGALAHLPALLPLAIPVPSDGPTSNLDAAPSGFRSTERAPPKQRPKRV
jgi:hypothetical protein